MRVEDPKRPRVTLLFTSSAITCPPRRALLLDSTSPASFTPTCTTRDGALLMRVALWDSKVGRCREAPMKPAVASTKSSDERNKFGVNVERQPKNCACDADRTCRTFRCIERDALQRASNAPGVGSERHVVLPSASDEADAKIFLADSSRFLSPVRRCEPEDRGGVGIGERGPSAPRLP